MSLSKRGVTRIAVVAFALVLSQSAHAAETAVLADPANDADGNCTIGVGHDCDRMINESQPAADIVAVHVATGDDFVVDTTFLDVDRPVSGLRVGGDVTLRNSVHIWFGSRVHPCGTVITMQADREGSGTSLRSGGWTYASVGGSSGHVPLPLAVAVDTATNRVRFSVPTATLQNALPATCSTPLSIGPGTEVRSITAYADAYETVVPVFPKVDREVGGDYAYSAGPYTLN